MIKEQLFINNIEVPLSRSLDPSITRSIADIRNPQKRNGAYSKSVTVPHSKEANKVFTSIYDINFEAFDDDILLDTIPEAFDPNIKADIIYLVEGAEIITGYCQLKKITLVNNVDIEYTITIFDQITNFFTEIKGKDLTEVEGLEIFDHALTKVNQNQSTGNNGEPFQIIENGVPIPGALGQGYIYPLIDFGLTYNVAVFKVEHLGVSIFVKELWDRVFQEAGFSYEFRDIPFATHFDSLIIPSSPEDQKLTADEIEQIEFEATENRFETGLATSINLPEGVFTSAEKIRFITEVVDVGNNYANPIYTVPSNGYYNFTTKNKFTATFTPDTGDSVQVTGGALLRLNLIRKDTLNNTTLLDQKQVAIIKQGFFIGATTTDLNPTSTQDEYYDLTFINSLTIQTTIIADANANEFILSVSNVFLEAGDEVYLDWQGQLFSPIGKSEPFETAALVPVSGNAVFNLVAAGSFANKVVNTIAVEGNTIKLQKAIPQDLTQTDFIMNFVNMYNLYIDPDPNLDNNLFIAPRDEYYTNNIVDLTGKVSIDQGIEYLPMGALDAKEYLFKHKDDGDYLNDKYKKDYEETYGEREIISTNEFTNKINKNVVSSSPTPLADQGNGNNRVISTILKIDDQGNRVSTKFNWRVLFYGGLKDNIHPWIHKDIAGDTLQVQYPYAGHFDDPFNPTLDINFGLVKEVYYDDVTTLTDNNLYNKYHSGLIREITDQNSKLVPVFVNATPSDYQVWNFSDLFYFDNAYFRLNIIKGFNPTNTNLTKCEFLFLKDVSPFKPSIISLSGEPSGITPQTVDPANGVSTVAWDIAVTYEIGNIVSGSDSLVYRSLVGANLGNDPTSTEGFWISIQIAANAVIETEVKPLTGLNQTIKKSGNNYNSESQEVLGEDNFVSKDAEFITVMGDGNKVLSGSKKVALINSNNNIIQSNTENVVLINTDDVTIEHSNVTYIDGELVEAVTDFHSGFSKIEEWETMRLTANKQSITHGLLVVEGRFILDGILIIDK